MAMTPSLFSISGLAVELGLDRRTVAARLKHVPPDGKKNKHNAWHLMTALDAIMDRHSGQKGQQQTPTPPAPELAHLAHLHPVEQIAVMSVASMAQNAPAAVAAMLIDSGLIEATQGPSAVLVVASALIAVGHESLGEIGKSGDLVTSIGDVPCPAWETFEGFDEALADQMANDLLQRAEAAA